MKTLNKQIAAYTQQLRLGEIQMAYKGILGFIGKLRAAFIKRYPHYDVSNVWTKKQIYSAAYLFFGRSIFLIIK